MDQALVLLFGAWNADLVGWSCRARCWVSEGMNFSSVAGPSALGPLGSG